MDQSRWYRRRRHSPASTIPPRQLPPGLDPIHCTASNQRSLEPQPAWVGRSEEAPYRGVTSPFVSGGSSSTALEYGGFQQCSPRPASPARLPGTDWEIGSRAPRGLGLGVWGSWRTGSRARRGLGLGPSLWGSVVSWRSGCWVPAELPNDWVQGEEQGSHPPAWCCVEERGRQLSRRTPTIALSGTWTLLTSLNFKAPYLC